MSAGAIFMICVCAMFPTLIIIALVVKLIEIRRASHWPSTQGKIVVSTVQSRKNRPGDAAYDFSDTEVTNEPRIEYTYEVGGKRFRCDRFSIGEKTSGDELEEILARYPVGKVVTVYYDPANPRKALLERTLPMGIMAGGVGCLMALFIGGPLIAAFLYFRGVDWLKPRIAHPHNAPFVAAATGFGLLASWFALAYANMVQKAAKWPTTKGRIISSDVEEFESRSTDDSGRSSTHYKASIVYSYEVNGRTFKGDRLRLGVKTSASFARAAKKTCEKYPVGRSVKVYYDPKSPGESVLHPRGYWHLLIWIIPLTVFAIAWAVGTGRM